MKSAVFQKNAHRAAPDASWAALLENSAREVFEIMLGSQITIIPPPTGGPAGTVMAVVGLAGQISGVFSMNFTAAAATHAAKKMLAVEKLSSPEEMNDAVGEICNMVAGNFKAKVTSLADGCLLSVPTVITGSDFQCYPITDGESFQACLQYEGEIVWIILELSG